MRVLVLGAGVAGVSVAYHLWRDGHEVTVLDREAGPGQGSSFGNAGGLCPGFAGPWAAPGMPGKVLRMALQRHAPVRFSVRPDVERLLWVAKWLDECKAARFRINKARMQRVAHYSMRCMQELIDQVPGLSFDYHSSGTLQLLETDQELELAQLASKTLDSFQVPWRMLGRDEAVSLEPSLQAGDATWKGALYLPGDASGDSSRFCIGLAGYIASHGVSFHYGVSATRLVQVGGRLTGIEVANGGQREQWEADACVVALGCQASALLSTVGLRIPVYPLKGYSITIPITDAEAAPRMAIMDEHHKIMLTRLGDKLRVAGMAELVGYDLTLHPARAELLSKLTRRLFPRGLDFSAASPWAGLRPMTPDGPPILGATPLKGLYLNAGHGSNGWTQACGTGRLVADAVSGRPPAIDMDGLTAERFGMKTWA
ncbi:D-amino acid dehydrogenase [Cupriavidus basilensis]|uniref:D-amino acid dehydrogenase n=1 Tax=Cupriavidus basilensis TaxID=68895 RepID=A0ABT6AIG6_9BURK|nr:D-amino acid dehydrogenase [Cupriavidus basilensis]MDF3832397.1 D-amino acid dehydrogenase [Cupriavidus basilensis]